MCSRDTRVGVTLEGWSEIVSMFFTLRTPRCSELINDTVVC